MIVGIDEAGRGSVLGPMVICAFGCDKENKEELGDIEVDDSKLLTSEKRNELKKELEDFKYKNYVIEVDEIDRKSLGTIFREVIFSVISTKKPDKLIIDSPVPANNLESYKNHILSQTESDLGVVCENEADKKYPIVSAASIMAKQLRDQRLQAINKKYKQDFSGYPSDQKTFTFLRDFYEKHRIFPPEVREKWKTIAKVRKEVDQLQLFS